MKILSWNILSNLATKFNFAGHRLETPEEYTERYSFVIREIFNQLSSSNFQEPAPLGICLQEVSEDFIKQLKSEMALAEEAGARIPYQLYYSEFIYKQACLIHESYQVKILDASSELSKVQILGCSLKKEGSSGCVDGIKKMVIVNLHLYGSPDEQGIRERRKCLMDVVSLLESKKVFGDKGCPVVMVGDFNEEAILFQDDEVSECLAEHDLEPYRKNKKITSYHAYSFHFDPKIRRLLFDGLAKTQEKAIDQLVFSNQLMLKEVLTKPKNGLGGMQVPYKRISSDDEIRGLTGNVGKIVHQANYKAWASDHALMIYSFF